MLRACRRAAPGTIGNGPVPTLDNLRPESGFSLMTGVGVGSDDGPVNEPTDYRPRLLRARRIKGPLRRRTDDRLVAGLAAGVAARIGRDPTLVRTVFVLASLFSGIGVAAYALGWLLVPADGQDGNIASRAVTDRRGLTLAAGVGSLLIVMLATASALGAGWLDKYGWALAIAAVSLVLVWRNAPTDEKATVRRLAEPLIGLAGGGRWTVTAVRAAVAAVLLAAGMFGGLLARYPGHPTGWPLGTLPGALLVVAAVVVALGPWWLRIARELVVERQARVRAEERADIAARVHDSVLQTLALIQRRADDPQQVVALARAQERELRSWLFEGQPPGTLAGDGMTVAGGVKLIQREVEERHRVPVEVVTVGDCPLDDDLDALLAATREATVNAAKWSGADVVSIYAEVEPDTVSVFVRDRGRGFDPAAVPADRKGLAESVRTRTARRGGSATIRTATGEGTEVCLVMPRTATRRQPSLA